MPPRRSPYRLVTQKTFFLRPNSECQLVRNFTHKIGHRTSASHRPPHQRFAYKQASCTPRPRYYFNTTICRRQWQKTILPQTMSGHTSSPWFDPRLTVFIIWGTFILIFICVPCKRILHKCFHRMGFPCCSYVEEDVDRSNENLG
jgi:hypothetical protein